jgi:hypothetical protein
LGRDHDLTFRRTISRYGVKLRRADFPRDYPFAVTASLSAAYEEGFPVMSRYGQINYPTRNFALALFGHVRTEQHFLWMPFPACRHADGTISSSSVEDVWRMASEDSDELVPGFLPIHRLRDFRNSNQTRVGQMRTIRG